MNINLISIGINFEMHLMKLVPGGNRSPTQHVAPKNKEEMMALIRQLEVNSMETMANKEVLRDPERLIMIRWAKNRISEEEV